MRSYFVGSLNEYKDKGKKVLLLDNDEVGIFRIGNDIFAYKNHCPHQGGPVCQGRLFSLVKENLDGEKQSHGRLYDKEKLNIVCPWHGLEFDIRTGKHPGNPDIKLESFQVEIVSEKIYVHITD